MTVGDDKLDAYQYVCSPAVGITDTKININSTISDAHGGARYCTGDIKEFLSMFNYAHLPVHALASPLHHPINPRRIQHDRFFFRF